VLGATGSFAGALAQELLVRGQAVRALVRDPVRARRTLGEHRRLEVQVGDALDAEAVMRAAEGAGAIVHGVNYLYHQWVPNMERVTENVIAAARAQGASILFPGNVYGFGPQTAAPLAEDAEMRPNTHKGALRVRLERMLAEAVRPEGTRVVVLRAGDYFGPTVRNGFVDPLFGKAAAGKAMLALGRLDVAHQWAYVPDLACVGADLLEIVERVEPYEVIHYEGYVAAREGDFLRLVAEIAGHPGLAVRTVPWWLLGLLGLVNPLIREVCEMRYLFESSVILHGARLRALLPDHKATPIEEAVRRTLESYR